VANFTNIDVPVIDRAGNVVGTDVISTPTVPLTPATVNVGCVRVTCSCRRVYENIPQAQWDSWASAPREVNGVCGCVAHFV